MTPGRGAGGRHLRYPPAVLTLDEARALLASRVRPMPATARLLDEAAGLRLAAAPSANADLPPSDLSAMDGYAARAADLTDGTQLPVAFVIPAGAAPGPLPAHTAARIFTGAAVPSGADTVVPQEHAKVYPDGRVGLAPLPAGSNVRRRGEVFTAGAELGRAGDRLAPARIAALAAGGAVRVSVFPRPRSAVLVSGAELVAGGTAPGPGQVRDSNGPMLAALVAEAGLPLTAVERVGDELAALSSSIARAAASADLVVASGGVSVGDFDLVPRAVADLGGEVVLHNVAIQPGKPILVATIGATWFVGLPGNPVSVLVGWRMFVRPLAEALAGDTTAFGEIPLPGALTSPIRNRGERTQLRPALAEASDGEWRVTVFPWKGSHDILAAAPANALALVAPGADLAAGAAVGFYPLPWRWAQ